MVLDNRRRVRKGCQFGKDCEDCKRACNVSLCASYRPQALCSITTGSGPLQPGFRAISCPCNPSEFLGKFCDVKWMNNNTEKISPQFLWHVGAVVCSSASSVSVWGFESYRGFSFWKFFGLLAHSISDEVIASHPRLGNITRWLGVGVIDSAGHHPSFYNAR